MVTKNAPIVICVYACKFSVHGAVMNRNMIMSRGHALRSRPKGAAGPRSCRRSRGSKRVSIEKGSFRPRVKRENRMNSQKFRSFNRSKKRLRHELLLPYREVGSCLLP